MMSKNNYQDWTKEDLIQEIKRLKKRKKYGLVWDEEKTKEKFESDAEGKLPVLVEDRKKEIITDADKPVNILIEGDNYHALSVLNYTHPKSIDIINIDPPYNTGNNDFKYNDRFVDKEDSYRHSKWLSFMEKRLKLAKSLLKDSGVIFISIDDNEAAQLKLLCDEIFGEQNFIANYIWESRSGKGATARHVVNQHEYVCCYSKNIEQAQLIQDVRETKGGNFEDKKGKYRREQLRQWGQGDKREDRPTMYYLIKAPDGTEVYPIKDDGSDGRWRVSKTTMEKLISSDDVEFVFDSKKYQVYRKVREGRITKTAMGTLLFGLGTASTGTIELKQIFRDKVFDTTKPLGLIKYLINLVDLKKSGIVLDFMAGSGTTGHAILELNKEDGGNRQFILCTNNENNICTDVCYPRVQKVIKGYKNSKGDKIDGLGGNLKYFKTAFVGSEPTHRNKKMLTDKSVEMLCIKENTFEEVLNKPVPAGFKQGKAFRIFKNKEKYLAILFDEMQIDAFKKEIGKLRLPISVYVFSLEGDDFREEFEDLKNKITLCSIPEAILKVYRRIFK